MLFYVKVDYEMIMIYQDKKHNISCVDYGFVQAKDEDRVRDLVQNYYQVMDVKNLKIYVFLADKDSIGEVTKFVLIDNE